MPGCGCSLNCATTSWTDGQDARSDIAVSASLENSLAERHARDPWLCPLRLHPPGGMAQYLKADRADLQKLERKILSRVRRKSRTHITMTRLGGKRKRLAKEAAEAVEPASIDAVAAAEDAEAEVALPQVDAGAEAKRKKRRRPKKNEGVPKGPLTKQQARDNRQDNFYLI